MKLLMAGGAGLLIKVIVNITHNNCIVTDPLIVEHVVLEVLLLLSVENEFTLNVNFHLILHKIPDISLKLQAYVQKA